MLAGLEELVIARQEIQQFREVLLKDTELIVTLRAQVGVMQTALEIQGQMLVSAGKLSQLQDQAISTYQRIAAMAEERTTRAEEKLERAQRWSWVPLATLLVGLIGGIAAVRW